MNERIKELIGQAQCVEVWGNNPYNGSPEFEGYELDAEKFAELIVRECMKVAVFKDSGTISTAEVAGWMAAGRSTAAKMIKEHFGVEE